jgi:predicted AAA+ superfamily ATPase
MEQVYGFEFNNQNNFTQSWVNRITQSGKISQTLKIHKADNLEVDFVVRDKNGYTKYIQVAYTVKEPKTLERELAPFAKIPDFNERLLITMDYETGSRNGVKQVNVIDWFLNS